MPFAHCLRDSAESRENVSYGQGTEVTGIRLLTSYHDHFDGTTLHSHTEVREREKCERPLRHSRGRVCWMGVPGAKIRTVSPSRAGVSKRRR